MKRIEVVSIRIPEDVWQILESMEAEGLHLDKQGEFTKTWALVDLMRRGVPGYVDTLRKNSDVAADVAAIKSAILGSGLSINIVDTPGNRALLAARERIIKKRKLAKADRLALEQLAAKLDLR
jgi:hypothetical protein